MAVATDDCGNVYVAGQVHSTDLPVRAAYQPVHGGGPSDAFVAKFSALGDLIYATYLGGSGGSPEGATGVAAEESGEAVVVGFTASTDFPVVNAAQPASCPGNTDGFVTRLDPDGRPKFSTYLCGSQIDFPTGVALDSQGNASVVGYTDSWQDFPQRNALRPPGLGQEPFLTRFDAAGRVLSSSMFGGTSTDGAYAVTIDGTDRVVIAGTTVSGDFPLVNPVQLVPGGAIDGFVVVVEPAAPLIAFATYLGGSGSDDLRCVATDVSDRVLVAGSTRSSDYPAVNALQPGPAGGSDAVLTVIDTRAAAISLSTYLGGSDSDVAYGIACDSIGRVHLGGRTASVNFPLKDPLMAGLQGTADAFYTIVEATGSALHLSTYFGGGGSDAAAALALDPVGGACLVGSTSSADFPTASAYQPSPAGGGDAFVARIDNALGALVPGPVGNTLLVVRDVIASEIVFSWQDIAVATSYDLRAGTAKEDARPLPMGSTGTGRPGLRLPMTAEARLFFNVGGVRCGQAGPL